MSKRVLIVESDASASSRMRSELESHHFGVVETSDGKGSVEMIRRDRPDLVVLAVDLPQGQNGYILCSKLKKDDELKSVPIVIIGNADLFAQHRKLKTHADDYVPKPVDAAALTQTVGRIIGFPEPEPTSGEVIEDESLSLSDLVDEEPQTHEIPIGAEEISVEDEATVAGDPELDMLDAAFDDIAEPSAKRAAHEEQDEPVGHSEPPPTPEPEEEIVALDTVEDEAVAEPPRPPSEDLDLGSLEEQTEPPELERPPPPPPAALRHTSPPSGGESRALQSRINELEQQLSDAESRANQAESRAGELEVELTSRKAELEAAKSTGGKSDKEFFALREAASKRDKEVLRLKTEVTEKERELVELKDREMQLEQQVSESTGELARRDAQIKTLTARADQLTAERKKFDGQLQAAKEEARSAHAKLTTFEAEFESARAELDQRRGEGDELRSRISELESEVTRIRDEADELRAHSEELRSGADSARHEAEDARSQLEQAQIELDSAKNQLTTQATNFAEEAGGLRRRVSELEESTQKHEERVTKFYTKIKDDEKVREKTKKALSIALQLLEEQQRVDMDLDEPAEA
jgi:DNA-binding response OmpR family regulator/predicted  nucleic acid-binding Zn-ribbon protein